MRRPHGILRIVEASAVLQLALILTQCSAAPRQLDAPYATYHLAPSVPEVIEAQGYPVEIHEVTTDDGYILSMHRIPYGANASSDDPNTKRPVAFLHHGLTSSSADFVMNSPRNALAFQLADAGYDVWLANGRGNQYSRAHVTLDVRDPAFWDFSFDQIGEYDLPAEINYILLTTGQDQLSYIGYSMGCTVFFVAMNEHPELMDKIKVMVALAPGAYMQHVKGLWRFFAPLGELIDLLTHLLNRRSFVLGDDATDVFLSRFCGAPYSPQMRNCLQFLSLLIGPEYYEMDQEILPLAFIATPSGASAHQVLHYEQLMLSGGFNKFDYGTPATNRIHYGQDFPPSYSPWEITVPVAIFTGDNDYLATPEDVNRLSSELPNVIFQKEISQPHYNHMDFLWGRNADDLVYKDIIRIFDEYN